MHIDDACHSLCALQDAHAAFQAVSGAAKLLQDSGRRAALDAVREDKELRAMAEAEAASMERARQWRVVKGEEPAGVKCSVLCVTRTHQDSWALHQGGVSGTWSSVPAGGIEEMKNEYQHVLEITRLKKKGYKQEAPGKTIVYLV
jgi:hypothetical protein